jgi:His-Xaa-Ser system protein HxsD
MSKLFPQLRQDELGDFVILEIDSAVFPPSVVLKAAYWLTDRFYLYIDQSGAGALRVEIRQRKDTPQDALLLAGADLCNKIVDFSVRAKVDQETRPIREALVSAAFAEGLKSRRLGAATSDESAIDAISEHEAK